MRKYYVHYYDEFANTYHLYYTENENEIEYLPDDSIRISRKEAEKLAKRERESRKYDPSFSGIADAYIYPADYQRDKNIADCYKNYVLDGYIWRKVNENL